MKCEEVAQNVKQTAARFQHMSLETTDLLKKIETNNDDLEENFKAMVKIQEVQLDKLVKILKRMLGETADSAKVPKVLALMEQCDNRQDKISDWSVKLLYSEKTSKKRRKP